MYFAHSTPNSNQQDWQLLRAHLEQTAERAGQFARAFGAENMGRMAGLLHDIGKYSHQFQRRLTGDYGRVDHSTAGAKIAIDRWGSQIGQMLAFTIAGHHAGLANGREDGERTTLANRISYEFGRDIPELCADWKSEIKLAATLAPPPLRLRSADRTGFQTAFLIRMIFSCLVDADYLDTEAFYAQTERQVVPRGRCPSLAALRGKLNGYLSTLVSDRPVNRHRAAILSHARNQAGQEPGVFSLTVPTGGGKTLSSLSFALDHAIHHGLDRVIYVIPFTSIVEQNAAVFRQAFGDLGEQAVVEHHSNFQDDRGRSPEARDKLRLAMENWDAPVVVTTAVQFFESLFADRPSRCRKLHHIARSVVILDEAQTLPLKHLRPCVAALDELTLNYNSSVVLCTATQPALKEIDDSERSFKGGLRDVRELAPDPAPLYRAFRRVTVRHVGEMTDTLLADELTTHEQVLCIVNNRLHARTLFEAIADQPGAAHLTTLMCARHRSDVLERIRAALAAGKPCRLVATSLIEAGVDVDFPRVLRAEAGLDSIAQAAGRCNRENRRHPDESEVVVFAAPDWAPPPELLQFAQAAREVMRHHDDPLSLQAIEQYFRLLYWQHESGGDSKLDARALLTRMNNSPLAPPFESIARDFRIIENAQLPVIIPYDRTARDALRSLEYAERAGHQARKLQPYIVQIPRKAHQILAHATAIQPVAPARFGDQFMVLVNDSLYHPGIGLRWEEPELIESERLVW